MTALIGRGTELERLVEAVDRARAGSGGVVLLTGEAGMGKTRLAGELARSCHDALVLSGSASHSGAVAYGPVVAALRGLLRSRPGALAGCGPLGAHLALILPELGEAAPATDRLTLFEAICCALARLAEDQPVLVILDDLHWSDEATLELLSALAAPLAGLSVLVLAAYRSDGLARDDGMRRLRHELRRARRFDELVLGPLAPDEVAQLLAATFGGAPSPSLVRAVYDLTQGTPFFVEELAGALQLSGPCRPGAAARAGPPRRDPAARHGPRRGADPRASELSDEGRGAAEAAAVAGEAFDLDLDRVAVDLARGGRADRRGWRAGGISGSAVLRDGLTRDALYADVPWMRRRTLHRALAEALETGGRRPAGSPPRTGSVRDGVRARAALLRAAAVPGTVRSTFSRRGRGRASGARSVAGGRGRRACACSRSSATRAARSCRASSPRRRSVAGSSRPCSWGSTRRCPSAGSARPN